MAILDVSGNEAIDVADIVGLASFLFGKGPPPGPACESLNPEWGCPENPGCQLEDVSSRWRHSPTAAPAYCRRTKNSVARIHRTASSAVITTQRVLGSGSAKGQARFLSRKSDGFPSESAFTPSLRRFPPPLDPNALQNEFCGKIGGF